MSEAAQPGAASDELVRQPLSATGEPREGPRISSISIDGFGALSGLEIPRLGPGLTVILGPNEAGKSTLFDFVAGVLFGFPNRKADPRYHAPVRGGRHGGRLTISDRAGRSWLLERYTQPKKSFVIRRPDGSQADESEVRQLLGGATEELFRAVFAVNLDDLGQLDGMSSAEVREVLFSSSVLGRRRSTARVLDELEAACDDLVRPRQGGAANKLAEELRQARRQLEEARAEAASFATLRIEREGFSRRVAELGGAQEEKRRRIGDLELLQKAWEVTGRVRGLERQLSEAEPPGAPDEALLERAERFSLLREQFSGHLERVEEHRKAQAGRERLVRTIRERAGELGEAALGLVRSGGFNAAGLRAELEELREALGQANGRLSTIEDKVLAERQELAALPPGDPGDELLSLLELSARLQELRRLKEWQAERDLVSVELERRALQERTFQAEKVGRLPPAALFAFYALAVLLAGLGVVLATRGQPAFGSAVLFAGVLLAAAAAFASRARTPRPERGAWQEGAAELRARLDQASAEVARLAEAQGLGLPLSPVVLQQALSETERLRDERRVTEDERRRRAAAAARLAAAEAELALARASLEEERRKAEEFARRLGAPGATLGELSSRLERLATLQEREAALSRIESERQEAAYKIGQFESRLVAFAEELSAEPPAAGDDGCLLLEEVEAFLAELGARLDRARARLAQRSRLAGELATAEGELDRLLGNGEHAEELREELASGQVLDWTEQATRARAELSALLAERDAALRAEEGLSRRLDELVSSNDVPRLEQRVLEIEEGLRQVLESYLVTNGARLLLQETLGRYEKERQPAVLALASRHFAQVTEGRYVNLRVDSAPDGSKPAIRLFGRDGSSLDASSLSRGAMEQLYLSLRLGLAESFADRYLPLPLVLDDVLVNSDPGRRQKLAGQLALSAERHQVIFLTCHPEVAELLARSSASAKVVELSRL